MILTDHEGRG